MKELKNIRPGEEILTHPLEGVEYEKPVKKPNKKKED